MKVPIKKKASALHMTVRMDAEGKVVSLSIDTKAKATTSSVRNLSGRSIGAVAGTLLSMAGGALKGAIARNKNMTPERRKEIAERAAEARWGKKKKATK